MNENPDHLSTNQPEEEREKVNPPEQLLPGRLALQPQELALTDPESRCTFQTGADRRLMMTPAALAQFGIETILTCFYHLQYLARLHAGLSHLQVFEDPESRQELWFIEDAPGVVTALLPDDR
jgi:hypothetical protein